MKKLNLFDLYGTTFKFNTFGDTKFHTWLGLFLSLASYTLVAAFIGVFGLDLFNRSNPKIISEGVRPLNYSRLNMTTKNFTFAWRLEDDSGAIWDYENVLYPSIEYISYERNPVTNELDALPTKIFEPTRCNATLSPDPEFNNGRNISQWYCLDFSKEDVRMGGFWDGDFVYYFNIYVYYCKDNDGKSDKCTSLSDLKSILIQKNKIYFSILYPDFFFEPNNLISPLRYQYVNYYNQISANLAKTDRIFLRTIEAEDDQDLLFTKFEHFEQKSVERFSFDQAIKLDQDYADLSLSTELYSMVIYFSKNREKYIRTFMKLQDLAATVGGFMQLIFVAGKILCHYYNSYERNITLINELFEFKTDFKNDPLEHRFTNTKKLSKKTAKFVIKPEKDKQLTTNNDKSEINQENMNTQTILKLNDNVLKVKASNQNINERDITNISSSPADKIEVELKSDLNVIGNSPSLFNKGAPETALILNNKIKDDILKSSRQLGVKINQDSKSDLKTYENMNLRKSLHKLDAFKEDDIENIRKKLKESDIKHKKEDFSLGFCLFIKKFFCRKVLSKEEIQKVKIYEFAINYLVEKLDITCYMSLISNFDRQQIVNFNESQKHSFKCIKKPNLNNEEEMEIFELKFIDEEEEHKEEEQKNIELIKYFSSKLIEDTFDKTDALLFDLLDHKYKKIIWDYVYGNKR